MNKFIKNLKIRGRNTRGDTIVEVLISMSILSLILAVAFVSSSHSLQSGTDSANRQQALALAQQQAEIIKNAANLPAGPGQYTTAAQHFCIDSQGNVQANSGSSTPCSQVNGQPYSVDITHSSNTTNTTFTITTTWTSSNNGPQNKAVIYYKIPTAGGSDSAKAPIVSQSCSAGSGSISPTAATLTGRVNPNGYATTYIFSYGTSAANLNSKAPASGPVGLDPASGDQAVSQGLSGLGSATLYYFALSASNTYGTSSCRGTFTTLGMPAVGLSASSNSIIAGQNDLLTWTGNQYVTNCPGSSPGSWAASNTSPSGSLNVAPTQNTTYTITCQGAGVSATSNQVSIVVSQPQPQVTGFSALSPINYGSGSTLSWSSVNSDSCLIPNVAWVGTSGSQAVGPLYSDTVYQISCYKNGVGWSATSSVTVHVNLLPQVTGFSATSPINYGASSALTWSSTDSDGCLIPNVAWVGPSGSVVVGPLYSSATYQLNCYKNGIGWSAPSYVTVHVNPPPQITGFSATSPVNYGSGTTLYWSSINTDGCLITNVAWTGPNGSLGTGALYGDTTFELNCYQSNVGWSGPAYASVHVNPPPQITNFTASSPVDYGSGTTLTWNSIYADGCLITNVAWTGPNGSLGTGALYGDTTFELNCYQSGVGWSGSAYAFVHVNAPNPPDCSDRYVHVDASASGGYASWSSYVGGYNPCGLYINQCDVFTDVDTYQVGDSGDGNFPGNVYMVGCQDIGGLWGWPDNFSNSGGGGGSDPGTGGGSGNPCDSDPGGPDCCAYNGGTFDYDYWYCW